MRAIPLDMPVTESSTVRIPSPPLVKTYQGVLAVPIAWSGTAKVVACGAIYWKPLEANAALWKGEVRI